MDEVTTVLLKMLGKSKVHADRFHLEQLRQTWPDLVGKALAKHTFPDRLSRKRLTVRADKPAWSGELLINKEIVLAKLNTALGGEVLKDLVFSIGPHPRFKNGGFVKTIALEGVELTPEETKKALAACPKLEDKTLAARAQKFFLDQARRQKSLRAAGGRQCSRCGAFIETEEKLCPVCRQELQQEARVKLARLLSSKPWLTEAEAVKQTGCPAYLYRSVKESLKAFYNQKVRQESATPEEEKLAVVLTYGRAPEKITATDYVNALKAIRGKKKHVFSDRQ
jgi:DNA-binding TFAR19-related protein (PDSD5 family)